MLTFLPSCSWPLRTILWPTFGSQPTSWKPLLLSSLVELVQMWPCRSQKLALLLLWKRGSLQSYSFILSDLPSIRETAEVDLQACRGGKIHLCGALRHRVTGISTLDIDNWSESQCTSANTAGKSDEIIIGRQRQNQARFSGTLKLIRHPAAWLMRSRCKNNPFRHVLIM